MEAAVNHLLCIGMGYSATAVAHLLAPQGWRVTGTSRSADSLAAIASQGFEACVFDGAAAQPELGMALESCSHLLVSVAPGPNGDPVLAACADRIATAPNLRWVGYLSTVGVYGDTGGAWVDEDTVPAPRQERGIRRIAAEKGWLALCSSHGLNGQIFRLAGIYGPGRNPLLNLIDGTAQRIVKPGQVFNRIHVADIAQAVVAGMVRGQPGRIYNVTDNEPAPPDEVIGFAARLLGIEPPAPVPFAAAKLSPMAASFYADNRRVKNDRLRNELAISLLYPTFREGLTALAATLRQSGASATQGAARP
jgi:hypothetical protein